MDERWLLIKATLLDEGERLVVSIIEDVTGRSAGKKHSTRISCSVTSCGVPTVVTRLK